MDGLRTLPVTITGAAPSDTAAVLAFEAEHFPRWLHTYERAVSCEAWDDLVLARDGVASLEDIEATVKLTLGPRLPAMGPFEYLDLSGLDLIATVAGTVYPHLDCTRDATSGPLAEHLAQGWLGMKTGRGFHLWTSESAAQFTRQRDQELIRRHKIRREQDGRATSAEDRLDEGQ